MSHARLRGLLAVVSATGTVGVMSTDPTTAAVNDDGMIILRAMPPYGEAATGITGAAPIT